MIIKRICQDDVIFNITSRFIAKCVESIFLGHNWTLVNILKYFDSDTSAEKVHKGIMQLSNSFCPLVFACSHCWMSPFPSIGLWELDQQFSIKCLDCECGLTFSYAVVCNLVPRNMTAVHLQNTAIPPKILLKKYILQLNYRKPVFIVEENNEVYSIEIGKTSKLILSLLCRRFCSSLK